MHRESSSPLASNLSQLPFQHLQDEAEAQTSPDGLSNSWLVPAVHTALSCSLYMQSLFRALPPRAPATYDLIPHGHGTRRATRRPQIRMRHTPSHRRRATHWIPRINCGFHTLAFDRHPILSISISTFRHLMDFFTLRSHFHIII